MSTYVKYGLWDEEPGLTREEYDLTFAVNSENLPGYTGIELSVINDFVFARLDGERVSAPGFKSRLDFYQEQALTCLGID